MQSDWPPEAYLRKPPISGVIANLTLSDSLDRWIQLVYVTLFVHPELGKVMSATRRVQMQVNLSLFQREAP
jgi:hypothetical protein